MGSVNRVILVGHLGKDPEVRRTSNGKAVANFTLATSRQYQKPDGQKVDQTEWHRVVAYGRQAEICGEYLGKGKQLYVEGRLQTRSWEEQQGQKRYTTEIVMDRMQFLGRKDDGARGRAPYPSAVAQQSKAPGSVPALTALPPEEDLPF